MAVVLAAASPAAWEVASAASFTRVCWKGDILRAFLNMAPAFFSFWSSLKMAQSFANSFHALSRSSASWLAKSASSPGHPWSCQAKEQLLFPMRCTERVQA